MMALTLTSTRMANDQPSLHHTRSSYGPWTGPTATRATTTGETPVPDALDSLTPKRSSLLHRSHQSRRSVPSFNIPSLQNLTASASVSTPASTRKSSSNRNSAPVVAFSPNISSGPNAGRPLQDPLSPVLRPDVRSTMPSSVAYSETRTLASDHGRALNGAYRLGSHNNTPEMDDGRPKNEDVFLNIARTDSGRRDSLGRSDFRRVSSLPRHKRGCASSFVDHRTVATLSPATRKITDARGESKQSRLGYSTQSLRSPTTRAEPEHTPSPDQRFSNADSPLLSQKGSPTIHTGSVNHSPSASTHPLDDPARLRYSSLTSGSRSVIGAPRSRLSRTSPETSPRSPPVNGERRSSIHEPRLRHSTLSTVRSSRQPSTSEATERARGDTDKARDGTESTLSTNAPSTVWDELDDLKSRIRKLELTGKLPPSSQEAISGAVQERPRTAATTVTTLSTSPRHHRKVSTPSADADYAAQSQVHPLLQSALAKAKDVLTSDVYTALEATIKDALTLSAMLGVNTAPSGTVSVVNGGYSSSERHARRKADSVCRSLTELCLALTDKQLQRNRSASTSHAPGTQPPRANGVESESSVPGPSYQRASSHEPEGLERRPSTSSRMSSRLESRRLSLINPTTATTADTKLSQSPSVAPPPSRLHRMSASLRSRRPPTDEDTLETATPLNRSLSRAMTEVGTPSPAQSVSPRQRLSHDRSISRSIPSAQQPEQHEHGMGVSPRTSQYSQLPAPSQTPQAQPRTPTSLSQSSIPFRRSYMAPAVYSPATSRSNIQAGSRRYGLSPSFSSTAPGSVAEESPRSSQLDAPQTRISVPSGKSATSYTPIQQPRLRTNSLGTRRFGLRRRSAAAPDDTFNLDDSID